MDPEIEALVLRAAGARSITGTEGVQSLWSGYGQIVRCHLKGGAEASVIVKHVRWPDHGHHPRGWNSDRSHERKVTSYQVESTWYERYADRCSDACRVPRRLALETRPDGVVIIVEDLDAVGFAGRRDRVGDAELEACLSWLASFHATFMGTTPDGLWATGTYWHLATRPDELAALAEGPLKASAGAIDGRLSESPFQTLVHGDAKLANFCFDTTGQRAAAVDFQYVGGGCGMKDVAYFISSCVDDEQSGRLAPAILDRYFDLLRSALHQRAAGHRTTNPSAAAIDADALEADWRALYPVAWADFTRFLRGWSPGHWKLTDYSERLTREAIEVVSQ